jgi:hypothetical protein
VFHYFGDVFMEIFVFWKSIFSYLYIYSFLPRFSCTVPPIAPSGLKFFPIAPSFENGPPTLSAIPPIAPSALNALPIAPSLEKAGVPVPVAFSIYFWLANAADGRNSGRALMNERITDFWIRVLRDSFGLVQVYCRLLCSIIHIVCRCTSVHGC